jgi:hypothetical protein
MSMLDLSYFQEFQRELRDEPPHVQQLVEIIWDMALQAVNRQIIYIQSGAENG